MLPGNFINLIRKEQFLFFSFLVIFILEGYTVLHVNILMLNNFSIIVLYFLHWKVTLEGTSLCFVQWRASVLMEMHG